MPAGRPRIPDEVKRRRGTLQPSRTSPTIAVVPTVDIERIVDGPIVAALVASGATTWIGESDAPMVRLAQRLWDDMDALRLALDDTFDPKVHAAYLGTVKELGVCLSKLGMSPSDRGRLGVVEMTARQARSKLEELMDRRRRTADTSPTSSKPSSASRKADAQAS